MVQQGCEEQPEILSEQRVLQTALDILLTRMATPKKLFIRSGNTYNTLSSLRPSHQISRGPILPLPTTRPKPQNLTQDPRRLGDRTFPLCYSFSSFSLHLTLHIRVSLNFLYPWPNQILRLCSLVTMIFIETNSRSPSPLPRDRRPIIRV